MQAGHAQAVRELQQIIDASQGSIEKLAQIVSEDGSDITFEVTIRFSNLDRVPDGLPVNARERFSIVTPRTFPFGKPRSHVRHDRFAGFPHVLWRRNICLYQTDADWCPEDGMFGFIQRLDEWIRDAALNRLDPEDAPLHPPVVYSSAAHQYVVPIADAPTSIDRPWFGYASLEHYQHRIEIIAWTPVPNIPSGSFGVALLLHKALPFEFPTSVRDLFDRLRQSDIDILDLTVQIISALSHIKSGTQLYFIIGTPQRRTTPHGQMLPHLAVWRISAADADNLRNLGLLESSNPTSSQIAEEALSKFRQWHRDAAVSWCFVQEARPQVTTRRDRESSTSWFRNKSVEIWGCGAVGTHVAESVVRAGADRIHLYDNKCVTHGVLVRQAFDYEDIGLPKARALAARLRRINPKVSVTHSIDDLMNVLDRDLSLNNLDLIIDCTGSTNLQCKLESVRWRWSCSPPIASIGVSHDAKSAIATTSMPTYSGGPYDLLRKLKLKACRTAGLHNALEVFWPSQDRPNTFQPEPGCSEPTFVGSFSDVTVVAARMLNEIASQLKHCRSDGYGSILDANGSVHNFPFKSDLVVTTNTDAFEIRVSGEALKSIVAWDRTSVRRNGPTTETGGLAFGELNHATQVLWVSEVDGPPPDSSASPNHFTCGVEDVEEVNKRKRERYRDSVGCVGSWHTHPESEPTPSIIDLRAISRVLSDTDTRYSAFVMMIFSRRGVRPRIGAYLYRSQSKPVDAISPELLCSGTAPMHITANERPNIGLALSGGGSRAIAFHLGCLRALHDLNLLQRLKVISSVSGGSIVAAMYSYSTGSFNQFDARVMHVLSKGFVGYGLRALLRPITLTKVVVSALLMALVRLFGAVVECLPSFVQKHLRRVFGWFGTRFGNNCRYNASEVFCDVLNSVLFEDVRLDSKRRNDISVVINSTEIRTGSAFRFGSNEIGCWRYGTVDRHDVTLAEAVAASVAYPVILPPLHRSYQFMKKGRSQYCDVLLSDGGIYDNSGVTTLDPSRDARYSSNVFSVDYIISCDAGSGLMEGKKFPVWWTARMIRSFESVFRKAEDATRKRLHEMDSAGDIRGFILSYLGQQDGALPGCPKDLPKRDEVFRYPTTFRAMKVEDIEKIARRGEVLTRLLVSYYHPDV